MKQYKVDVANMRVVEMGSMEKPEYAIDHFKASAGLSMETSRADYDNRANWAAYNDHLRSLTSFPLDSIPEGWKDGNVVEEEDFEIRKEFQFCKGHEFDTCLYGKPNNACDKHCIVNLIAVPIVKDEKEGGANFVYAHPDSHFWTSIEMLMEWLKHHSSFTSRERSVEHLVIGLQNTLKNGYDIQKLAGKKDEVKGCKAEPKPDNAQCTDCTIDQPYPVEIMAEGVLCGGCGRRRPNVKYIIADNTSATSDQQEGQDELWREVGKIVMDGFDYSNQASVMTMLKSKYFIQSKNK